MHLPGFTPAPRVFAIMTHLVIVFLGMSAIIFRVRKWHDIWVAGKASGTIVLPSTFDELRLFLGKPVHQLARLLVCAVQYSFQLLLLAFCF